MKNSSNVHHLFKDNDPDAIVTLGEFGHVAITRRQYDTLSERFGPVLVADIAEDLDDAIETRRNYRKRYRNVYAALRQWLKREQRERTALEEEHARRSHRHTAVCFERGCRL